MIRESNTSIAAAAAAATIGRGKGTMKRVDDWREIEIMNGDVIRGEEGSRREFSTRENRKVSKAVRVGVERVCQREERRREEEEKRRRTGARPSR